VKIYKNRKIRTGFLTGKKKDIKADYLFSTMQSMNNNYESFKKDDFNYIVIDECHHAASAIYENLVSYFEPEFLLGMTATPERTDSKNIFDIFDNNVALEIRLKEALKENLLVPFHYFGITDIEDIDIANINIDDIKEIAIRLSINKRVEYIIEKMDFYGFDGPKRKALGFCASIEHAKYMRDEFNIRNIPSLCITGEENPTERIAAIKKLEDENDKLEVIFTVDVFNEGIDIPSLNLVLMLRPTNSPIIFIQQLGRGLRKNIGKEFLTVLDFIGNHSKAFLIAIALNGSRYYDKDSLKVAVKNNFSEIGGCTNIHMERISQQRIIDQLNYENFNTMKYLKEEYAEFKNICKGRIPKSLIDYIIYEGAPDPIKFIDIKKSYLKFLSKAEKEDFKGLTNRISFMNILEELSSKLPIKRIYEFVILKYLLSNASITIEIAKVEILKHIENVAERDIEHSFQYLNQQYYDPSQKERKIKFVELNENILTKLPILEEILLNADMRFWIVDIINYGILRYEKEFGSTYYGTPFLKKYEQYRMTDVALLSNYTKLFSSYRGSGLITNGDDYFIFVNLHKGEKTPENINYKDKLKTQELFQWQSPNATRQDSDRGRNIIFNTERNIKLHLFIRKHEEVDGAAQQFLYLGECNSIKDSAIGERPITIQMKLEHPIPLTLYKDLTEIVN
jgi:superfamily II DNA or RNA helicase